jgi:adenosylcobinamide kinase/adenosylcobinamide-phosphate guanylyltransferase
MAPGEAAKVVLVTGGARSGKSRFAQGLVEGWGQRFLYIATAEVLDDEMAERVRRHRDDRGRRWRTLEEPLDLPRALAAAQSYDGALLDCLTLWTSNLLGRHGVDEDGLWREVETFLEALRVYSGRLCLVTNEVGSGIVPEHPLARRFRDEAGRINQRVASQASEVFLVVSGLPLRLK